MSKATSDPALIERERCISLMEEYMSKRHSKCESLMIFEMEIYMRNAARLPSGPYTHLPVREYNLLNKQIRW